MRSDIRRLRAIGKKELITLTSYRVNMMMQVLNLWYFAIAFYFIGEFVGDPESIQEFEGGYFEFVLIGSIVTSFAITGMQSFGSQISEEQDQGTLQAILATPTPMWTILTASYIVPSIFVIVETIVLVGVGLGI